MDKLEDNIKNHLKPAQMFNLICSASILAYLAIELCLSIANDADIILFLSFLAMATSDEANQSLIEGAKVKWSIRRIYFMTGTIFVIIYIFLKWIRKIP